MTTQAEHLVSYQTSRPLSRRLAMIAGVLFTGGVSIGWLTYVHRSASALRHVPGTSAWWQHAVVAAVALAIVGVTWLGQRRGRVGPRVWLAPLSSSAAHRSSRLFIQALWSAAGFARAVAATLLMLLLAFCAFRAGYQITSGLDPNSTVNAWGGPTYVGAMACHYLDLFVLMAAVAWLLDRLLPGRDGRP